MRTHHDLLWVSDADICSTLDARVDAGWTVVTATLLTAGPPDDGERIPDWIARAGTWRVLLQRLDTSDDFPSQRA